MGTHCFTGFTFIPRLQFWICALQYTEDVINSINTEILCAFCCFVVAAC